MHSLGDAIGQGDARGYRAFAGRAEFSSTPHMRSSQNSPSETAEKGYEQGSEREFGRYREDEMGRKKRALGGGP
jgi:hypothetical protein